MQRLKTSHQKLAGRTCASMPSGEPSPTRRAVPTLTPSCNCQLRRHGVPGLARVLANSRIELVPTSLVPDATWTRPTSRRVTQGGQTPDSGACGCSCARAGVDLGASDRNFATIVDQSFCDPSKAFIPKDPYYDLKNGLDDRGKIYLPQANGVLLNGPIVFLVSGKHEWQPGFPDFFDLGWEYLMKSLASCGFIAVAGNFGAAEEAVSRRDRIIRHLKQIRKKIQEKGVNPAGQPIVLVGHSKGGEAVTLAAAEVLKGKASPEFLSVAGIVALAPTRETFSNVTALPSTKLLVLQGALDGDTDDGQGVATLDIYWKRALVENQGFQPIQSLFWIHGGTHGGFADNAYREATGIQLWETDKKTFSEIPKYLSPLTQNFITGALVSGFVRTILFNDPIPRKWFYGNELPLFTHSNKLIQAELLTKMRLFPLRMTPPDDILCEISTCPVSGGLTFLTLSAPALIPRFAHRRNVYRLGWDLSKNSLPFISFPVKKLPASLVNLHVEFDATQLLGAAGDMIVQVAVTGGGLSNFVQMQVAFPQVCTVKEATNVVLGTIRVPVSLFPAIKSVSDVKGVLISFAKSSPKEELVISAPRLSNTT